MSNGKMLTRLLLFSGLIAMLIMSVLFDIATSSLQVLNSEGAGLEPLLVVLFPLFEVITVLGGLGLFWYLFTSPERDRLIGWVFAVVGLLLAFGAPLLFFLPVPMTVYSLAQFVAPGTYLFLAGALLGVAGVLSLVMKREAGGEAVVEIVG